MKGFSDDFRGSPVITIHEIANYLICEAADADGEARAAFKSFNDRRLQKDNAVRDLQYLRHGKFAFFKAEVMPTQKKADEYQGEVAPIQKKVKDSGLYKSWILVESSDDDVEIKMGDCKCQGG